MQTVILFSVKIFCTKLGYLTHSKRLMVFITSGSLNLEQNPVAEVGLWGCCWVVVFLTNTDSLLCSKCVEMSESYICSAEKVLEKANYLSLWSFS